MEKQLYRRSTAETIAEFEKLEDSWSKGDNKYVKVVEKIPGTTTVFYAEPLPESKPVNTDKALNINRRHIKCEPVNLTNQPITAKKIKELWYNDAGYERGGEMLNLMTEEGFTKAVKSLIVQPVNTDELERMINLTFLQHVSIESKWDSTLDEAGPARLKGLNKAVKAIASLLNANKINCQET